MRIKFRRMLIPAFTLVFSILTGVWFYLSYTDLDLFSVKNLESQAGPCSDVELIAFGDFQSKALVFLAQDSDSSLVDAFHSNNDLLESFQVEMGCYTADQIRNLSLECKACLMGLINHRVFQIQTKRWENTRRGLFIRHNENADSTLEYLRSVLLEDYLKAASHGIPDSSNADSTLQTPVLSTPVLSADSLKFQLSSLISKMNGAYYSFMSNREQESARLAEARLEHGLRMGEARMRLFLFALIAWMASLSLMSALYLKSVFKRSVAGSLVAVDPSTMTDTGILNEEKLGTDSESVAESSAVSLDYDLSKVFFDSGGDIQVMKKRLNQHLVSSFAAIGNLKSYHRSGNADGAIRVLQVLSESNQSLGFMEIKSRLDAICHSIEGNRNAPEQWVGLEAITTSLATQIEVIKDRMDHHPAFKG